MPQVMSASSNSTPPNVVAGATGEIPGIKDNKVCMSYFYFIRFGLG